MVVDDEPAVRELMTRALGQEGYEVVAENDGEAGLTAAMTAEKPYDLVITNNHTANMVTIRLRYDLRIGKAHHGALPKT